MTQWFVFLWGVYALENYLNFRQWKVVRKSGSKFDFFAAKIGIFLFLRNFLFVLVQIF